MPQASQTPQAVGQTAGRGGGTHRRDLRRPKGPRSPSWPPAFHLHGQLSDPLHGAIQFRLHRIALALLERGVDPAGRFLATARAGRSLRPTGATEVAPARHAKAAERPHACAPPSIAGQVPAGLPAKPGCVDEPSSRICHRPINSNFFSKLSVMFRSSFTSANSVSKEIGSDSGRDLVPRRGQAGTEERACAHLGRRREQGHACPPISATRTPTSLAQSVPWEPRVPLSCSPSPTQPPCRCVSTRSAATSPPRPMASS